MGLKNWSQALRYLEQAVQLKTRANDYTQMTVIFNNIGQCYRKLGDGEMALSYFKKAEEKGRENGQMGDVVNSYRYIANYYKEVGDFERAFSYQNKLINLKDSLSETERLGAIEELEVMFETKEKEQEILMLKQSQTIITNRWLTLAMVLFLIIVIAILFADNQKRKHRQERELLEKEDELKKAELKIMSDLLEYNRKKLTLYTDNLLKKNELVGQLEEKLNENFRDNQQGANPQSNFSNLRILTDEDWNEFKELFNGVHRGLLNRLVQKHQNLTLAEQRLFLLMKLELSTKEIANILGVSPDSIKKGRYRLKKKLNVNEAETLQDFVSSF
jgi:DNA-binding CsgD family transcriptional regulator/cbb3-type cytochrome oxidase subunit 3